MNNDKKQLRAKILDIRRSMDKSVRQEYDEKIYNILSELDCVKNCSTFLVYASSDIEVDTRRFISALIASGKTVAVPKCVGKEMHFLVIKSLDDLVKSRYGVDEPENGEKIQLFTNTVCIVPALSFDKNGFRLGWGGGFYDKFLANYSGISVGICYEQCCGNVPKDKYDLPVNMVITENGLY